jgi:hypothetical protein
MVSVPLSSVHVNEVSWVTVIVFFAAPLVCMVTVAVRVVIIGLAATSMVNAPSPLPEVGLTVHHETLLVAVHALLLVTVTMYVLSPVTAAMFDRLISKAGIMSFAACVTVTVFASTPLACTVRVAVRAVSVVLSITPIVNVPLLSPESGFMRHHSSLLIAVHGTFAVTDIVYEPPFDEVSIVVLSTDNFGVGLGGAGSLLHEAAARSSATAAIIKLLVFLVII